MHQVSFVTGPILLLLKVIVIYTNVASLKIVILQQDGNGIAAVNNG